MKIQLSHYEFDLTDRYASGQVIGEGEAKALNVERSDRIRNRAGRWLERHGKGEGVLTGEKLAELRQFVADLDASFEFEARSVTKPKAGTIEAEMREVAQERAEALARQRGREGDAGLIRQLVEGLLQESSVEAEAAARIEARKAVAMAGLADL